MVVLQGNFINKLEDDDELFSFPDQMSLTHTFRRQSIFFQSTSKNAPLQVNRVAGHESQVHIVNII
jgi:hypothetical protein